MISQASASDPILSCISVITENCYGFKLSSEEKADLDWETSERGLDVPQGPSRGFPNEACGFINKLVHIGMVA